MYSNQDGESNEEFKTDEKERLTDDTAYSEDSEDDENKDDRFTDAYQEKFTD